MDVSGKVVVITGGAQGLGYSMAQYFASAGANIALLDCDTLLLEKSVEMLQASGVQCHGYSVNVAQEKSVCDAFGLIKDQMGGMDVLVNNAGILRDGLLLKVKDGRVSSRMSFNQWQSVIDVNLTGVFLCGREAAAAMVEGQRKGVIINISSVARFGNIGQTNYAAAKAGVVAMTTTWARELGRYGIRVAAIAPGVVRTAMTDSMKPAMRDRLESMTQVNRLGEPAEVAHAANFIIENDFFTGRVLEIDGGVSL